LIRLIDKGCTTNLKGFKTANGLVEGLIRFDDHYALKLEQKKQAASSSAVEKSSDKIACPKCKKGSILKGKTAYGCSDYKTGCDFVFTFENIKRLANGKQLTKELVLQILKS
jgi:DNA topoisomerase-3